MDEFAVAGDYLPAAGVSGDFYDAFSVSGARAAFVLGDVAGRGIPAAVLMGVLHGAVRSSCWMESSAFHREATRDINRLLCDRAASNRFATMFWSYFDPRSQHLKFINAGHCPPLLVKSGKRGASPRLQAGGPVLGLLRGAEFEQGSVRLDVGDCLILYSDGIVEATNAAGDEFGEDRLLGAARAHSEKTAEAIRDAILRAVHEFTGKVAPDDDRTLVVAVYTGAAATQGSAERDTLAESATGSACFALTPTP